MRYRTSCFTLLTILFSFSLLLNSPFAQEDQTDTATEKLQKLLEEKESSDADSSSSDAGTEAIEKANKELHGGESAESREQKKPGEVLDEIIEEMDTAARSLEDNVQNLRKIKGMLDDIETDNSSNSKASSNQKEILKQLKKLFDESKENQQNVSKGLEDLLSFKKQLQSAKSSQSQSLSNIEKLLKVARKQQSSSQKSSSGRKKKQQKNQGQKQKQQAKRKKKQQKSAQQRKKQGQPADKPYEATSDSPEAAKTHSTGDTSRWGNLPDHVRKEVIQRRSGEFVPEYSDRLRQYYKKLGEDSSE